MTDHSHGSTKKFLYQDQKKLKANEEERQFHSKGYHPQSQSKLIDLEKVWSVKDLVLDSGVQSRVSDGAANANSSYYSRHGQYKSSKSTDKSTNDTLSSTWNRKNDANSKKREDNSSSPFDF